MNECQPKYIEMLAKDELGDAESLEFETHLEHCVPCRQALEGFVSAPAEWATTQRLLRSSADLPNWGAGCTAGLDASREWSPDLAILAPSDDPRFIGRIGAYEVLGVVGRGGMGVVFKAVDRALNRNVAVKVLDPSLSSWEVARSRFAREAKAMATLSTEHVVPIFAVEEHRNLPFFAMEYVAGGTLESRLQREGSLDVLAMVRIAHQVAGALAAAHAQGLVHRDIKPANILLDRGSDRVRVADFGLARVASEVSHTRSGMVAGTPQYMSPEQVRGEECDWRSDLFSLGCVMYAMGVGQSPFAAPSPYAAMHRIVHERPTSLRDLNPAIPRWLEQFIMRLLEKDPSKRFQSAQQVIDLLALELQQLQGSPSRSDHFGWRGEYAGPRFSRRRRQATGLLTTIALAACAVLLTIWLSTPPSNLQNDAPQQPPSGADSGAFDAISIDEAAIEQIRADADFLTETLLRAPREEDAWNSEVNEIEASIESILKSPY